MSLRNEFVADVEAFLTKTGMGHSALGRRALNDPTFVKRLRDGRDPTTSVVEKVRAFMQANKKIRAQAHAR